MGSLDNRYVSTISGMIESPRNINKKNTKKIKKYCREYCEYSGIHGLRYFGEKRSGFEKICWILVFITSLLICIAVIYQTYKKWQHAPIMVNFSSDEKNINEIPFPAVTICREIRISKAYFNYSYVLRKLMDNVKLSDIELKRLQYMSLLCAEDKFCIKNIPNITTINEDIYSFLSNGSQPYLQSCVWMGIKHNCSEIFRPIVTDEGLCYTFNMLENEDIFNKISFVPNLNHRKHRSRFTNEWTVDNGYSAKAGIQTYPRRALLAGSTNALIVNMRINVADVDYACTSFQGYQVVLHQPIRYPIVQVHYFRIPMRKAVIVAISPKQMMNADNVNDYDPERRECYLQGQKQLKYFRNYTQNNCALECTTNFTMMICGCVAFYMPRVKDMPICGNGKLACMKDVKINLNMRKLSLSIFNESYDNNDECGCLPMCNQISYETEITEIEYDRHKEYEALGLKKPKTDEKYVWSQLVIYFKSSYFIPYVRSELYGSLDFLANVGGLLGLFIGFSLLSLFEIFYFLSVRIMCNIRMYKRWYGKH